ncbi:Spermidine/putrescine import ABC transporter permease protein PotC (TC 3.A.1.11.1) [hydrothermal vent metagenome]|uniref:Spermidine/putrescine import ABC transporter permease protein PotC (TC 3.A.1.11.1) n=1 Tax=hydrothermal vent metagenome TaxID=652676 RepID=A0A3B0RKT2_9ZZZZ
MTVHEGASMTRRLDRILAVHGWVVLAFLYLPILVVIVFSFSDSPTVGVWGGLTLRWYGRMFANDQMMRALRNSLWVATWSTLIATILGTTAALALDKYKKWVGRGAFDAVVYLPVIIPDVTMAVMLLLWFTQIGLPLGTRSIILAHIAFNISFVAIVVRARLANMDPSIDEAAADLYASPWQTFRKVTFPLILPGVLGGALLALTLSLDDVVITSFVQGPGSTTLPVYVFGLIKRSVTPEINAVSTIMLAASVLLVFSSLGFQRRGERSERRQEE